MAEVVISHALTTKERVKNRLTITSTGFDTLFDRLISGVTDYIESQCDRRFKETTYTNEIYSIYNSNQTHLVLKQAPVSALSSVQYAAGTPSNKSWTNYSADDYELVDNGAIGMVKFYGAIPTGSNPIRLTYTAGYKIDFANAGSATHTLPFDLSDLAERLVVRWFKRRESEGKKNEGYDQSRIEWSTELMPEDKETIFKYKRVILI
jgi:hypothetical protein